MAKNILELRPYFEHDDASLDDLLDNYFVPSGFFSSLPDQSQVIVGRYGTGKTAFVQKLSAAWSLKHKPGVEIPIDFRADLFAEELLAPKDPRAYVTLARTLIYLHLLYTTAARNRDKLVAGDEAKFLKELKDLNLGPYKDLIERMFALVASSARKVKRIGAPLVGELELQGTAEPKKVTLRTYRELCLRLEPVVEQYLLKNRILVTVDAVDTNRELAKDSALVVSTLLQWLLAQQKRLGSALRFYVAMPSNLLRLAQNKGVNIPEQNAFAEISWNDNEELAQVVRKRVRAGLGKSVSAEKVLRESLGVDLERAMDLSFGRPRDLVKLVRKCLDAKARQPALSAEKCWARGLKEYARETLDWIRPEFQLTGQGFDEVVLALKGVKGEVSKKSLAEVLGDPRKTVFRGRGITSIVSDLEEWGFLTEVEGENKGERVWAPHPIFECAR